MLCLVNTRLERWSRQADIPFAAVVAALAIGLFVGVVGDPPRRVLHAPPSKGHASLPAVRNADRRRRGPLPRRPARVPAGVRSPSSSSRAIGDPSPETFEHRFEWMMLFCGAALVALMAVALTSLGRRSRADDRGARIRRDLAAPGRAGDPDPLRPVAGGADGRGARVPGRRPAAAGPCRDRARIRREALSRAAPPARGRVRVEAARTAGSARLPGDLRAPWRVACFLPFFVLSPEGSGTASPSREAARSRSRASGRRCCSRCTTCSDWE